MNRALIAFLTVFTTVVLILIFATSRGQPLVLTITMLIAALAGGFILVSEEMAGTH